MSTASSPRAHMVLWGRRRTGCRSPTSAEWTKSGSSKTHTFDTRLNPFCLRGDFDGDGAADFAVLIKQAVGGKQGIAIVHRATGLVSIVGAGKPLGNGGDNFDWMDAWSIVDKAATGAAKADPKRPALKGDAILAVKTESAGGLIWWDGTRYRWSQHGN